VVAAAPPAAAPGAVVGAAPPDVSPPHAVKIKLLLISMVSTMEGLRCRITLHSFGTLAAACLL
jgi:hypothetical protein